MKILWEERAWEEYCYWQTQDKKTLKRINIIIRDIQRDFFHGVGKPEALKGKLSGYWSRRVDNVNRVVYSIDNNSIQIISCKGHYDE